MQRSGIEPGSQLRNEKNSSQETLRQPCHTGNFFDSLKSTFSSHKVKVLRLAAGNFLVHTRSESLEIFLIFGHVVKHIASTLF